MLSLSAITCSFVTFIMALLHILLTLGFPIGEYVLGGKDKVIPVNKRWQNFILALIFLVIGIFYIIQSNILKFDLSPVISRIVMILFTLFLAYAIIGNIFFTKSKKEKFLMIPLSAITFIASFITLITLW